MKNPGAVTTKRILVVEDEAAISWICQMVLTSEGFEVDIAVNGQVAQEMLGKMDYDLVLIDIRTPIMNGKQLYQVIIDQYPKLAGRVIFNTGDVMDGHTQRFLELAGRPFLPKPFSLQALLDVIGRLLSTT